MISRRDKVLGTFLGQAISGWPMARGRRLLYAALAPAVRDRPILSTYGVFVVADLNDATNRLYVQGYDADDVAEFVARLEPGDCFVDVGANQGLFSVLAAKRVGSSGLVIAFEPQIAMAARLKRNASLNEVDLVCMPYALSSQAQLLRLAPDREAHSGTMAVAATGDFVCAGPFPAELLTEIGSRKVFAKIDCEGYELSVLQGMSALLPRIHSLVIEIDSANLAKYGNRAENIYDYLAQYGLRTAIAAHPGHYDAVFSR